MQRSALTNSSGLLERVECRAASVLPHGQHLQVIFGTVWNPNTGLKSCALCSQAFPVSRPLVIAAPRATSSKHGCVAVSAQAGCDERGAVGVSLPKSQDSLDRRSALGAGGRQNQRGQARRALSIHRSASAQQRPNQRLGSVLARMMKGRTPVSRSRVSACAAGQQDLHQVQPISSSG